MTREMLMNRIGDNLICTGSNQEVVQIFSELDIDFVLIGGLAVAWYCAERQADDMDLLVNPTHENAARISQALARLGYSTLDRNALCQPGMQLPLKKRHYAEIFTPRVDGPSYESVVQLAVQGKVLGVPIRIVSAASLIELKKLAAASGDAAMQKHLLDIELLGDNVG